MKVTLGGLLAALLACTGATRDATSGATKALIAPYDDHYGIYLNGHKVGWMRTWLTVGSQVVAATQLRAQVGGLGQVAQMQLDETRSYDATKGSLVGLSFRQAASTGSVEVEGKVRGERLMLSVKAGEAVTEQSVAVRETLRDLRATTELARVGRVGASEVALHFDASVLKNLEVEHRIVEAGTRLLDGVSARVVRIESRYRELGITESTWMDAEGRILESKVGGFFVARLEPEDVAKRLTYQQDILVSAVVKPPQPLTDAESRVTLRVTMRGLGDLVPPSSERQRVELRDGEVTLRLARDPVPPQIALTRAGATSDSTLREWLEATPFIQSQAVEIQETARRVAGDAADIYSATSRLTEFVYRHVRDAYVPAYSNALEALKSGRGDCTEHAVLFVALSRALGIPARVAVGIAYWPEGGGFGWHAWSEVRIADRWYSIDPTWNQPLADVTHIKLADGGPAEQARIVMVLGNLEIVELQ